MKRQLRHLIIVALALFLAACNQSSPLESANEPELQAQSGPTVTSIVLSDAKSGRVLATLKDGSSVSLAKYAGKRLKVQAKTSSTSSVSFSVDGKTVRTDTSAPFTLTWTPSSGNYTLKATPAGSQSGISTQGNQSGYPLTASVRVTK